MAKKREQHNILNEVFFGSTTMGSRGQVVIPAAARQSLKMKTGDKLMVFGKFGQVVGLVKAEAIDSFIKKLMSQFGKVIKK